MPSEKVLLVNPFFDVEWKGVTPPIGQGYLAETLQSHGIDYDVFDMNLGYNFRQLCHKIDETRPTLVGVGMITRNFHDFYNLVADIKKNYDHVRTIAGGPHVTIMKEQVLQDCPALDYGVVHEGEETLVELCKGERPIPEIKGLLYRNGAGIAYSGDRDYIKDLNRIPWPRYEKYELDKYFKEMNIFSSRGCPRRCIFCARPVISALFRARSAESVVDEIEYWYRKGYRQFNFEDDNFNLIKERVLKICDEIERRGLTGMLIRCSNGIRADRADRHILARMREVGFRYLAIGVDAGNDRMLEVIKKGETMEQIETAIRNACDLGYSIKLFFVFGNPTETTQDVEDMARLSLKYPIGEAHFNSIIPYPGTELYKWIEENGYFLEPPEKFLNDAAFMDINPVFETPELPREERMRLKKYLEKVRREVHRRAVRRIFRNRYVGLLASLVVANSLFEALYYKNRIIRKIIERYRYTQASGHTKEAA
jgi:anaerobic magnesium-protoporphyrin IX monomethyl ester cyclase